MVVTTTVVFTVVMDFPVTSCLVIVTGDVVLDIQRLNATRVCSYIQKHIMHLCFLMISRLTQYIVNERNNKYVL